jgi:hypothetical protein
MEKKEITAVNPVSVGEITIIPVSRIKVSSRKGKRGIAFSGSKQPDSVIIASPSGRRAFRITGEEVSLDQITEEFPGISEKLEEA